MALSRLKGQVSILAVPLLFVLAFLSIVRTFIQGVTWIFLPRRFPLMLWDPNLVFFSPAKSSFCEYPGNSSSDSLAKSGHYLDMQGNWIGINHFYRYIAIRWYFDLVCLSCRRLGFVGLSLEWGHCFAFSVSQSLPSGSGTSLFECGLVGRCNLMHRAEGTQSRESVMTLHQKNQKLFFDHLICTIPLIQAFQQWGIYGYFITIRW